MADPVISSSSFSADKLEDLARDLTALKRRISTLEAMFGTEPERGVRVTARPASILLAKALGRAGGVKQG